MIYNFNLGIGWASSGVEYAQSYRANIFRRLGVDAKFIFTDMFPQENIEHMTKNIGFLDEEIIWIYSYFTDFKISRVTYNLKQLESTFNDTNFDYARNGKIAKYIFKDSNMFYTVYLADETSDKVHRVEIVSNGYLIRKDYFTYGRIYSEYYAPLDNKAHLYQRRYFNVDGSVAYEEFIDGNNVMYKFPDKILYSKEEFVGYFVSKLNLTEKDTVIIDRSTLLGQPILRNAGKAKVGIVVHADHFSENQTNEYYILWNNYYEYPFSMNKHINFYITATEMQKVLLIDHFKKYLNVTPLVYCIPVGSLNSLKYKKGKRKPFSLITASRLASEKHIDWVIEAVIKAHEIIPDLTLDIYGKGVEEKKLAEIINKNNAGEYITLKGQQDLTDVYMEYEAYISGSTSEGFGLTLMEAVGSGLPIIGFDVKYGNQNFIRNNQNGFLVNFNKFDSIQTKVNDLSKAIIDIFNKADLEAFHRVSYDVASSYLTKEIEKKWKQIIS